MASLSMTQKILKKHMISGELAAGKHIIVSPSLVFAHDPVMKTLTDRFYKAFGADAQVWNSDRIVLFQDHLVPAKNIESRNMIAVMDEFVKKQQITNYYQYGSNYGVCHIMLIEEGFTYPGQLILGTDSHTVTAGAFNCVATGVGVFDMVNIFKTGEIWMTVPETLYVEVNGTLPEDVSAKDIILRLLKDIRLDGANGKTIEWGGSTIENMALDDRSTLCNMVVEAGATNGIMTLNDASRDYLYSIGVKDFAEYETDPSYEYSHRLTYDATDLTPMVSVPHRPDNVHEIDSVREQKIDLQQVYVGGCTGGKWDDIVDFVESLDNKKVHENVTAIVVPATMKIYKDLMKKGYFDRLIDAGVAIESPGCKACYGVHGGVTGDDENVLATINRNFMGRMGNPKSFIYLSSPRTAAKSAVAGFITN
ncbi:MAG: aconitase/3-isopropylmalate dehydratase large subunit family protein [Pseudomonadota bacterium]